MDYGGPEGSLPIAFLFKRFLCLSDLFLRFVSAILFRRFVSAILFRRFVSSICFSDFVSSICCRDFVSSISIFVFSYFYYIICFICSVYI